jgi:hypothetical protein
VRGATLDLEAGRLFLVKAKRLSTSLPQLHIADAEAVGQVVVLAEHIK